MPTELETFHNELFQEVLNKAESEGALTDEAFFDVYRGCRHVRLRGHPPGRAGIRN